MNLVLYRRLTRSLVLSADTALPRLGRPSCGTDSPVLPEAVVCVSHRESALRSRCGWIWRGADIVGRAADVFLRRKDRPFFSSDALLDIVAISYVCSHMAECLAGAMLRSMGGWMHDMGAGSWQRKLELGPEVVAKS